MLREIETVSDQIAEVIDLVLAGVAFYLSLAWYHSRSILEIEEWPRYFFVFFVYLGIWLIASKNLQIFQSRRSTSLRHELLLLCKTHL